MPDRSVPAGVVVVFFVAALAGGAGAAASHFALESRRSALIHGWDYVPVTVAAEDLPAGIVLQGRDLLWGKLPRVLVTASLYSDPASLVGLKLTQPVSKGTPIHRGSIEGVRAGCTR